MIPSGRVHRAHQHTWTALAAGELAIEWCPECGAVRLTPEPEPDE